VTRELGLHAVTKHCLSNGLFVLGAGRPYFDPPGPTQSESLSNNVKDEYKYPERDSSSCFEIGHVDTSLDAARFTRLLFDELFRRRFIALGCVAIGMSI
jgi:hypothetical protein